MTSVLMECSLRYDNLVAVRSIIRRSRSRDNEQILLVCVFYDTVYVLHFRPFCEETVGGAVGGGGRSWRRRCEELKEVEGGAVGGGGRSCRRRWEELEETVGGAVGGGKRSCRRRWKEPEEKEGGAGGGGGRSCRRRR